MPIRIHRAHPSNGGTTMATITITAADAATDTAALHATATAPAATPADVAAAKRFVSDFVDRSLPEYQKISLAIHDKSEGFDVTVGVASHRTGFEAAYDTGRPGPTVVFLAEYDALPGIGHGCGHSVYGPNSSLAGAALKQVIDRFGGQMRVDGTPGEEGGENGSAKGAFVDEGFFDDADIALCAHPASGGNHLSSRNLACQPVDIEFRGKALHASGSPELGINSINALRQHLPKDVRVHGIITDGGGLPNVVPDYVKAKFYLRSASVPGLNALRRKVENIVAGAALATGAKGSLTPYQHQVDNMIPTPLFDEVWERNAVSLGQRVEDRSGQGQLRLERRRQRLAGGAHDPALVRHLSGAARRAQRTSGRGRGQRVWPGIHPMVVEGAGLHRARHHHEPTAAGRHQTPARRARGAPGAGRRRGVRRSGIQVARMEGSAI